MILVDASQTFNAVVFADAAMQEAARYDNPDNEMLLKHMILNVIRSYSAKFKAEYGNLVIATDGRNYWRRKNFPEYKAARKKNREESDINWDFLYRVYNGLIADMRENFPFKVIQVDRAEADDIIAVLCELSQKNTINTGFFDETEPVIIIASDKDYHQLLRYDNVKQWCPREKKFFSIKDPKAYLIEKCLRGDRGDGIPNFRSPNDAFVTGTRQAPVYEARIKEFLEGNGTYLNDLEKVYHLRNIELIDLSLIPDDVHDEIVSTYENTTTATKAKFMNWLMKNGYRKLLDNITDF